MEGAILGIVGIAFAIVIPLFVEYSRRPVLRIERSNDVNFETPSGPCRIVHVRVINRPLAGWRSKWLLRNDATGCSVVFTFRSLGDGREFAVPGRWSAAPQPLVVVPSGGYRYDPNRAPQSIILDVSPSEVGEALGVALKYDGDDDAFAFSDEAYADPRLCNPNLVLEDDGYLVHVDASAGEITASAVFELKNTRDRRAGLKLEGPIKHS